MSKYNYKRMRPLKPHQEEPIEYLEEVVTWMNEYENAVRKCVEAGISNVRIAYHAGKTETAIRMMRERRGF